MFMQKILYVIVALFIVNLQTAVAQDVFTLKNGTTLKARYIDRTDTQIRYKKWSDLMGETYSIDISRIAKIRYEEDNRIELFEKKDEADARQKEETELPPPPTKRQVPPQYQSPKTHRVTFAATLSGIGSLPISNFADANEAAAGFGFGGSLQLGIRFPSGVVPFVSGQYVNNPYSQSLVSKGKTYIFQGNYHQINTHLGIRTEFALGKSLRLFTEGQAGLSILILGGDFGDLFLADGKSNGKPGFSYGGGIGFVIFNHLNLTGRILNAENKWTLSVGDITFKTPQVQFSLGYEF